MINLQFANLEKEINDKKGKSAKFLGKKKTIKIIEKN